jgi:SAM-dependent methyltransferase
VTATTCPACGAGDLDLFHVEESVPTNSCLLLPSLEEAASYPRGRLALGFCRRCGFITNTAFEQSLSEYSDRYEETQGFSSRFVSFARDLAARWVEKYDLHDRSVLEIGCGKGEFLVMMLEAGAGRGIGIDPSFRSDRMAGEAATRIEWISDFYSERYGHLAADAVVCRHTLEHIPNVGDFMRMVRRAIGDRTETIVLFELPDVLRVLREVAFWDVYYEHCSYFSLGSLARLFRATGFEVLHLELDYDDQYLLIEARPSTAPAAGRPLELERDIDDLVEAVDHFRATFDPMITEWQGDVRKRAGAGEKIVIWGAGSKGVSYLTNLAVGDAIRYAVDINPYKHGMFMAGTGQQIVGPEFLIDYRPDRVIAMNSIYLGEIRAELDRLGVTAELVGV